MTRFTSRTRKTVGITLIALSLVAIVFAVLTFQKGNILFGAFDCLVAAISFFAAVAILEGAD